MMMGNMIGGVFFTSLFIASLFAGFAYIIWVTASKENNGIRIIGQVIAVIIMVYALMILLYGGIYMGLTGRGGCCGGSGMMGGKMEMSEGQKSKHMEMMMKDPQMRKMMEEQLKQYSK